MIYTPLGGVAHFVEVTILPLRMTMCGFASAEEDSGYFSKDIMTNEINYAEIAHRILGKLKEIDVAKGESLQPFMEQFEHLKLKEGFVFDVYQTGTTHGSNYQFYARNIDVEEIFEDVEHKKNKYSLFPIIDEDDFVL